MSVLSRSSAAPTLTQLGALLDSTDEGLVLFDARRRVVHANHAGTRLLGCESGQALESTAPRLIEPSRAALLAALVAPGASWQGTGLLPSGQSVDLRVSTASGGLRMLRAHLLQLRVGAPVLAELPADAPPLNASATGEVVRLLWDAPQPLLVQDEQFRVVAANRAFLLAVGLPVAQVLGREALDFLAPDDRADAMLGRQLALDARRNVGAPAPWQERRLRDDQGRERWYRFKPRWVSADDGQPLMLSVLLDITSERVAQDQVDRSVHELERWFDLSPVGMLVYDRAGLVLRSNATFEALVGRTPVMLQEAPTDLRQLLAWEGDAPHVDLRAEAPALEVRASVQGPDGRTLRLRSRLRAFRTQDGQLRVMAVVEDRSLEDERDLAVLEISALMDTAGVGVATYEASRGWLPSRSLGSGKGGAGLQASLQSIRREQVEPGSLAEFERLQRALRQGERAEVRYAVRVPDLGSRWLLTRVEPGELAEGRPALSVVTLDITELKTQQAELETLGRDRELMFNLSDVGIAHVRQGRIERANEALAQLTARTSHELVGLPLDDLFAPLPGALPAPAHDDWRGERQLLRADGQALWVQLTQRGVEAGRAEAGTICSVVDIDERRRAREALQLQAERTRAVLDSVLVGIVTVDEHGIEWMNRSARRMFGGELADFVGTPISTVATDEADHPLRSTHYRQALGDGQAETFECRLRARDGREFWVVGNAVVTGRASSGSQLTFALLDIERRRQAEISIAQAQDSLQRIIETAPLAIALFDASTARVLRLNAMAALYFGQSVEAILDQPPEAWCSASEALSLRDDLALAQTQADGLRRERQRGAPQTPDGARIWDTRIVAIGTTGTSGESQLLLVASEVTEQRAAEQARYEAAVSQRDMLVREVHHRIKNNLQGVAGLLQQTAARRPEVAALISEVVGQVQAIAQVHGLQVGVSGPMRIRPLLEAVTASVQRTFGRPIDIEVLGLPAHRFALPEAESIPIALTINELLTNAIKHSPPVPIHCQLMCEAGEVRIAIRNQGHLPKGFNLAQVAPGVSGLGLVRALLPRRSAELTLEDDAAAVGDGVLAQVRLRPPSFTLLDAL